MSKGFGNMMKQAQMLQKQMLELQEEVAKKTVEGSSGGGMVKVIANGKQEILEVKIDPQVVDPQDVAMLEDLVIAAIANAQEKARNLVQDELGKLIPGGLGSLNFPGLG
jgi:nucleoid-associated protein EbfC